MGSYVFFTFSDEEALDNVQWIYLAIALFVLLLATLFFFAKIPEITDAGTCNNTPSICLCGSFDQAC
jgi:FHS family L-fucose permease-like MFS transporter